MQLRHRLLLGFALTATLAVSTPGFANRFGSVFGLPSSILWNLAWLVASFVAVAAFHLADGGEDVDE